MVVLLLDLLEGLVGEEETAVTLEVLGEEMEVWQRFTIRVSSKHDLHDFVLSEEESKIHSGIGLR